MVYVYNNIYFKTVVEKYVEKHVEQRYREYLRLVFKSNRIYTFIY